MFFDKNNACWLLSEIRLSYVFGFRRRIVLEYGYQDVCRGVIRNPMLDNNWIGDTGKQISDRKNIRGDWYFFCHLLKEEVYEKKLSSKNSVLLLQVL